MWKREDKFDTILEKLGNIHTDIALIQKEQADMKEDFQKEQAENKNNIKKLDTRVKIIEKPFNYIKTTISLILLFGLLGGAVFSVQRVLPVKAEVETVKEIE